MIYATDIDETICRCARTCPVGLQPVFEVDLDLDEPVWICIQCLIGLEDW